MADRIDVGGETTGETGEMRWRWCWPQLRQWYWLTVQIECGERA